MRWRKIFFWKEKRKVEKKRKSEKMEDLVKWWPLGTFLHTHTFKCINVCVREYVFMNFPLVSNPDFLYFQILQILTNRRSALYSTYLDSWAVKTPRQFKIHLTQLQLQTPNSENPNDKWMAGNLQFTSRTMFILSILEKVERISLEICINYKHIKTVKTFSLLQFLLFLWISIIFHIFPYSTFTFIKVGF